MTESPTDPAELWREERLYIGGRLVPAASGATYENVNPATGEVIGVAADAGIADMDAAIAAARDAFDNTDWSTNLELRIRCLRQLQEGLQRHAEELRATTIAEVGAPLALTFGPHLDTPVEGIGWVADLAESYRWTEDLGIVESFGVKSQVTVQREPIGVVGAISPWNFPNQINLAKVAPALAAGCTVVLKPAPDTPWTGLLLGKVVAEETDIPAGVFNVITSSANEVSQQLCEDPRVDLISFTGSTNTGRKIMQAASGNLKKLFLELGGKSASVVLDDARIDKAAAATAFQVMIHAGQGCAIQTRLVVPRERYDEAVDAAVATMESMSWGDPTDANNFMGPIVHGVQRDKILGYIDTAVAEGAKIATGGKAPDDGRPGFWVEPTILTEVKPDDTVAQEEIFGPVLAIIAHDGDDDAVDIANNSEYGLSGAVYSGSAERARSVANRIRTGTLMVNGGNFYSPAVPFGGYKASGIGREMGKLGFEEYLEVKSIAEGVR